MYIRTCIYVRVRKYVYTYIVHNYTVHVHVIQTGQTGLPASEGYNDNSPDFVPDTQPPESHDQLHDTQDKSHDSQCASGDKDRQSLEQEVGAAGGVAVGVASGETIEAQEQMAEQLRASGQVHVHVRTLYIVHVYVHVHVRML